jgi:hypothetical protein
MECLTPVVLEGLITRWLTPFGSYKAAISVSAWCVARMIDIGGKNR